MNDEKKRELRAQIVMLVLETKSKLDQYRFLGEETGRNYDREMDVLLDRLNYLKALDKELGGKE